MKEAKLTVRVDAETWKRFRIACLERGVSAGPQIETLMAEQLAQWAKEIK